MSIIKYTNIARDTWAELSLIQQTQLRKHFHLRPTNSGVTVVSTLPVAPMRGIDGILNDTDLKNKLVHICNEYPQLVQGDSAAALERLGRLGFKTRSTEVDLLEESFQALMINALNNKDARLAVALNAQNIKFVASELIFESGKHRVDIVGYDECAKTLYLLELKKGRTTLVEQVSRYLAYYAQTRQDVILRQLLSKYPIVQILEIDSYTSMVGVMVMRYSERSSRDWRGLANSNRIKIVFYDENLNFTLP